MRDVSVLDLPSSRRGIIAVIRKYVAKALPNTNAALMEKHGVVVGKIPEEVFCTIVLLRPREFTSQELGHLRNFKHMIPIETR